MARTNRTAKKRTGKVKAQGKARSPAARKRSKPDWAPKLLAALEECGNITGACKAVPIGRQTFYDRRDADEVFAAAVKDAFESFADSLEAEATRRGRDGYLEPVVYKGELASIWVDRRGKEVEPETPGARKVPLTVRKFSDTLLIFKLNGHRPEKYAQRQKQEHVGKDGGPVLITTIEAVGPEAAGA